MHVYINGEFHPKERAVVSVFDHGYLYGDGIYETLRSYGGTVFKLGEHLERLSGSASMIGLELPLDAEGFSGAVYGTIKKNGLADAYVRITVSRGPGGIGLDPALCEAPTVVIMAMPLPAYPERMYEDGVKVAVVSVRRNAADALNPAIKSTNFLNNILAKVEAKRAGAYEGLMLNHEGFVTEGAISNVFMVSGGELVTPPPEAGILLGVTRRSVMDVARGLGINVIEKAFTADELVGADEAFLTNTTMEVMPVTDVDGRKVGAGVCGAATRRLRAAYREEVERCLKTP